MNDERSPYELTRAIDRIETDVREIKRDYLTEKLFDSRHAAHGERIARLEQSENVKTTGNRTWLLNLAGMVAGVVVSGIVTVLIARGGH